MAPLHAPLWGLARGAAAELPSRWGGLVDLDPGSPAVDSAAKLWAWLDGTARRRGRSPLPARRDLRRPAGATGGRSEAAAARVPAGRQLPGDGGHRRARARRLALARGARRQAPRPGRAHSPAAARSSGRPFRAESPLVEADRRRAGDRKLGATVHLVSLDVADHAAVIECINEHERGGRPPIRGVFHLAGTVHIEDALRVDSARLLDTLRPEDPRDAGLAPVARRPRLLRPFLVRVVGHPVASPRTLRGRQRLPRRDGPLPPCARPVGACRLTGACGPTMGFIRQLGDRGPDAMAAMKSIPPESGIRILSARRERRRAGRRLAARLGALGARVPELRAHLVDRALPRALRHGASNPRETPSTRLSSDIPEGRAGVRR